MTHKINISGIIGFEVTAQEVKDEFKNIGPTDEVEIELNSPGGSVFEGIEISNAIKSHKGKTNLTITSFAASMGAHIAMSADHVAAFEDATFMIHNASTIEFGDHRALRKTANVIESLSNMLSKAFINKTGKERSEVHALMDAETWFFGDEILNAGFVDEIIKSESPEDKDDAVAFQKLVFIDSVEKIKGTEKAKSDLDKLAAYFKDNGGQLVASAEIPKDLPETKPTTKEGNMNLAEFLAANPEAKVEYNSLIATAKTEAVTAERTETKTLYEAVGPVMKSKSYDEDFTSWGVEVLARERTLQSFTDQVAMYDKFAEKQKSTTVQGKQPPSTPGEGEQNIDDGTTLKSAKVQATITDLKKNLNV